MDIHAFNASTIREFRANSGRALGQPILLLTTIGARSGLPHITPLVHARDSEDRFVVYASKLGSDRHPDWYHNLRAHPEVTVEVGTETFTATARIAHDTEREPLFRKLITAAANLADHQQHTERIIPIVILQRQR